jgi:integrase
LESSILRFNHQSSLKRRCRVKYRMKQGAKNATINRELAALKRMLTIGARSTPPKVDRVPHIPMLKENNVRKGFFEHGDFVALRDELPEHIRGIVTFAYKTGWREGEILPLKWSQVDLGQGIVTLNPGETKNSDGRTVYLDEELREVFKREHARRRQNKSLCLYVFLNQAGNDGVKDIRRAWEGACKRLGLGHRLFHDLRRTAVRNMVRAGIPERVAMMISGHKTRSVFDRYNIVSDSDLRLAATQQETYLNSQMVTKTVTVGDFSKRKGLDRKAQPHNISPKKLAGQEGFEPPALGFGVRCSNR